MCSMRAQTCDPELFRRNVSYRTVNMNDIPGDLRDFDFTWSACSFEHLGSIERGKQFVYHTMNCLKPGGVAVHTTEYNLSSNLHTVDHNDTTVLFRRRDLEDIARHMVIDNHKIDLDFTLGTGIADDFIDVPPYSQDPHIKLAMMNFVTTSIGLIIEKDGASAAASTLERTRLRLARWYSAMSGLRKGA